MPEPLDPGSVAPDDHSILYPFESPVAEQEWLSLTIWPEALLKYDLDEGGTPTSGWLKLVTVVPVDLGLGSQPENVMPPGIEPLIRNNEESALLLVANNCAPAGEDRTQLLLMTPLLQPVV